MVEPPRSRPAAGGSTTIDPDLHQLRSEVAHWRLAIDGLARPETVASSSAWEGLEQYLQHRVRSRLGSLVASLQAEGAAVDRMLDAGRGPDGARAALLQLREKYLRAETLIDFYGDAVNSRTNPELSELLRGYDTIAADSMASVLGQLGIESPPALVYVDKGLGAAILRAGIRLWDQAHPSPAAAIKLTRHNLSFPTALLHETGHQVCALAGYNEELAVELEATLAPASAELAELWSSWSSEIAGDVHAFLHAGWAPAVALANVVDGSTAEVFRIRPGDPHPFPWIRVMFNVALCRRWFGPGPWDQLAQAWIRRHPPTQGGLAGRWATASLAALDDIVDLCTRRPMRSFRGQAFADLLDPHRVSPAGLQRLENQAGATLLTSAYLRRREPTRILALLATRVASDPGRAEASRQELVHWVRALGRDVTAHRTRPSSSSIETKEIPEWTPRSLRPPRKPIRHPQSSSPTR